jgi:hypothetical protein
MKKIPIFLHSLFRTGSTYIFNVFRRSQEAYWCYQEPLHEVVFLSRENPSLLEVDQGLDLVTLLRHPPIEEIYFKELIEVWPAWKDNISAGMIYNDYFAPTDKGFNKAYWQSLIDAAPSQPVFQECRTSGRISAMKKFVGGVHLYLWRNPWDQWWSYKIDPYYFDATSRMFIHSHNAPKPAKLLVASLGLTSFSGLPENIPEAFNYYRERPLSSAQSYQIFYMLWCLALREGLKNADQLLNIDQLSDSSVYRTQAIVDLQQQGIIGIDFSDCVIPQGIYSETERSWFTAQEAKVNACLLEGGWRLGDFEQVASVRNQHQPVAWKAGPGTLNEDRSAGHASRARELVKRFETQLSEKTQVFSEMAKMADSKAQQLQKQLSEESAQAQTQELHTKEQLQQALSLAQTSQAQADQLNQKLVQAHSQEQQTKEQLQQALSLAQTSQAQADQLNQKLVRAHSQEQQTKEQLQQALSLAQTSQAQADQLNLQLVQAHTQEQQTKKQLHQALSLALDMQSQGIEQAHQLQHAQSQLQQALQVAQMAQENVQHAVTKAEQAETLANDLLQEKQSIAAELSAVQQELNHIHQANHNHWLQLEKTRKDYDDLLKSSHHHLQLAEERMDQINSIFSSASWRITAPLRWLAKPILGPSTANLASPSQPQGEMNFTSPKAGTEKFQTHPQILDKNNSIKRLPDIVMKIWSSLEKKPKIKNSLLRLLRISPALDYKVRRMYEQSVLKNQQPLSDWQPAKQSDHKTTTESIELNDINLHVKKFELFTPIMQTQGLSRYGINSGQRSPLEAHNLDYRVMP